MNNRNRVPGAPNLDPVDPNSLIAVPPAPVPAPVPAVNAQDQDADEQPEPQPQLSTKEILKQLAKAAGSVVYNAGLVVYRTATVGPDGTLWINITGEREGKNKFDGSFINPQSNPNSNPYSNPYTSRQASAVAPKSTSAAPATPAPSPHS